MKSLPIPRWLDNATYALVQEIVTLLIKRNSDILLSIILFGSIARHDERPLDDPCPGDVDLLAIFDTTDSLVEPYRERIYYTIGDACYLHLDAPREVNVLLSDRDMRRWDEMFIENVAREGIILYARGPLPEVLIAKASLVEN